MTARSRFRWAWWLLAYASLGLGFIGIFVPVLPTVPFILLSAFAAARGSERLHRRLLEHRLFGPMIRDWEEHGAVSRRAKWMATTMMALCTVMLVLVMRLAGRHAWWMLALPVGCMAAVAVWLWFRPEPAPGQGHARAQDKAG